RRGSLEPRGPPWPRRWPSSRADPDAGIDEADDQVHQEVDAHDDEREEDDCALDDREVLIADRVDGERGHARPREHGLGGDGAAQQLTELKTEHGDDGNAGVAERVLDQDRPLSDALGPRRPDVVRVHDIAYARPID